MKKYTWFIIIFAVFFILAVFVEMNRPKEIDWTFSFSNNDKIPYGSYIVYKILPELFPDGKVVSNDFPIYNTLTEIDTCDFSYLFINSSFNPDELDLKKIFEFVKEGNTVFIAAGNFDEKFSDSLKIKTGITFLNKGISEVNFTNNSLQGNNYYKIKNSQADYYFSKIDTSRTIVLGINKDNRPNFIQIPYGEGYFYLNTLPLAFTNYNILNKSNSDYIYKSISYLPASSFIYWDEYYKDGKTIIRTPLKYILSQEPLKWAYYILIFSIAAYIVFYGRRRQRIIPVIKPPANTTLEFVNIIGRLYFQQKNHKNIADKKISYFLDQLRNRYYIKTDEINGDTIQRISDKSGLSLTSVKSIFNYISYLNKKPGISESELSQINNLIETFYKSAGIHGGTI